MPVSEMVENYENGIGLLDPVFDALFDAVKSGEITKLSFGSLVGRIVDANHLRVMQLISIATTLVKG
jgi:hypothetical protein